MEEIRPFESTTTINKTLAKNYVANVFSLMFTALIISGLAAVWFATDEMKTWIISPVTGGFTTFGWITMFSPLALVFLMGMGLQKFNVKTLLAIFLGLLYPNRHKFKYYIFSILHIFNCYHIFY